MFIHVKLCKVNGAAFRIGVECLSRSANLYRINVNNAYMVVRVQGGSNAMYAKHIALHEH